MTCSSTGLVNVLGDVVVVVTVVLSSDRRICIDVTESLRFMMAMGLDIICDDERM